MTVVPMFPLGSVLFPTMVLPLHIFEPRYRQLVADCLAGDQEFGVCLIERGSEVGGGEVRSDIGTVAQIVDAQEFGDGRWAVVTVGTRRIRIMEWKPDDPYPRARVQDWIDPAPSQDLAEEREEVVRSLRRVLALQTELGLPAAPSTVTIDPDPTLTGYQVAALSPIGEFDRQEVLAAESVSRRHHLLHGLLTEVEADLRAQLLLG